MRVCLSHYYCEGKSDVGIVEAYPHKKEAEKGVLEEIDTTRLSQFAETAKDRCGSKPL